MRILVAFKVTPDYEALRPADWAAAGKGGPETRYVRRILNCFDESALELALRLGEDLTARGAAPELRALTVGGREADAQLKTLIALGYERATRVHVEDDLDFAPSAVAAIIARHAGRAGPGDVLFLGSRTGPGDGGTVPFRVAETLGWPCLSQVTEVDAPAAGRLRVTCATGDGLIRTTLRPPCLLAVGNAVVSHLRVPTLTQRLTHRGEEAEVLAPADLGLDLRAELDRGLCAPLELEVIDRRRPGVVIDGATAREKARVLFDSHLRDRVAAL